MKPRFEIKGEHPLDRMTRIYSGLSAYDHVKIKPVKWRFLGDDSFEYCVGKTSKTWHTSQLQYSKIYTCDICGRIGGGGRVRPTFESADPEGWKPGHENIVLTALCFGCEMKLNRLKKHWRDLDELRLTCNRNLRKLNEISKNNVRTS